MNYRGSYRHLLRNSRAALVAAMEVYNKPTASYRDECFAIMLLNAWELLLKALLSKHGKSIYYPKRPKEPYRTVSLRDALVRSEPLLPPAIPALPMRKNLEILAIYRDNAVHFYNVTGFGKIIYPLAQTSVVNFKDLLHESFGLDLSAELSWELLPIGLAPPIDPIAYIKGAHAATGPGSSALRSFLVELTRATDEVESAGLDTGRLLTIFRTKLESTKKIQKADLVVGVAAKESDDDVLIIEKPTDPNVTHPLRQKEILEKVGTLDGGVVFTSYIFQAILWKYGFKEQPPFCWQASEGVLTRYSPNLVARIRQLSPTEIQAAVGEYRQHRAAVRTAKQTASGAA